MWFMFVILVLEARLRQTVSVAVRPARATQQDFVSKRQQNDKPKSDQSLTNTNPKVVI